MSSLPWAILSAASDRSHDASTTQGDLPPSSSVVGVRLAAAAAATLRPTPVEPVKNRWSNGRLAKSCATSAPPSTTQNSSAAKACCTSVAMSAEACGVSSLGLSITRLPAANAVAAGPKVSCKG
ncbi:hypothetical protein D9M69_561050 [compost metagenome]